MGDNESRTSFGVVRMKFIFRGCPFSTLYGNRTHFWKYLGGGLQPLFSKELFIELSYQSLSFSRIIAVITSFSTTYLLFFFFVLLLTLLFIPIFDFFHLPVLKYTFILKDHSMTYHFPPISSVMNQNNHQIPV